MTDLTEAAAPAVRLIAPKEMAARAGVSVRTLQRMVRKGQTVTPVRVSEGRIGYILSEADAWLSGLPRTRETA